MPSFLRLAALLAVLGTGAAAQGATLSLEAEDEGAGPLAAAMEGEAGRLLGPGGEFASCLARVGEAEGASHRVLIRTETVEGETAWTLEVQALPGGEVIGSASGSGPAADLEAQASTAAREALAPLCETQGGGATTAWDASGGGADITVTGRVESLEQVFHLQGEFPGGTAEFTYTPVSPGGGAVEYAIAGSGVTGSGEGLYNLTPQPDGTMLLEQTTDGCVDGVPGSCRTNTEVITLTPVAP